MKVRRKSGLKFVPDVVGEFSDVAEVELAVCRRIHAHETCQRLTSAFNDDFFVLDGDLVQERPKILTHIHCRNNFRHGESFSLYVILRQEDP